MKNNYYMILMSLFLFNGCLQIGHQGFIDYQNNKISKKPYFTEPIKPKGEGEAKRGVSIIIGQGFTHITKLKNGDLIHHWSGQEILSTFKGNKEWVGKCLTYRIIDAKTGLVKSWGFDKGGNPLSCRGWN